MYNIYFNSFFKEIWHWSISWVTYPDVLSLPEYSIKSLLHLLFLSFYFLFAKMKDITFCHIYLVKYLSFDCPVDKWCIILLAVISGGMFKYLFNCWNTWWMFKSSLWYKSKNWPTKCCKSNRSLWSRCYKSCRVYLSAWSYHGVENSNPEQKNI